MRGECRAHRISDALARNPRAQIHRDLELRTACAPAAIADVERMPARIPMPVRHRGQTCPGQCKREFRGELGVEPAYIDARLVAATMNRDDDGRAGQEGKTLGMIETMAGDVQI